MRDRYDSVAMRVFSPYTVAVWPAIILLLSLVSCRQTDSPTATFDDEDMTICFSVTDPISTTRKVAFTTDFPEERRILHDKVWVYEFLAKEDPSKPLGERYDGSLYLSARRLSLPTRGGDWDNYNYKTTVKPSLFLGYAGHIHPDEKRILLFVANAPSFRAEMVSETTTLGDLLSYAMPKCADGEDPSQIFVGEVGEYKTYIPMMGIAYAGSRRDRDNDGSPVEIKKGSTIRVNLVRMVARIDVATSIGSGQSTYETDKLVVKSMRLYNAPCYSTLGERRHFRTSASDPRIDDVDTDPASVLCGAKGLTLFKSLSGLRRNQRLSFEDKAGDGYDVRLMATESETEVKGLDPKQEYNDNTPGRLSRAFYLYETPLTHSLPEGVVSGWIKEKDQGIPYLHLVVIYGDGPEHDLYVPFVDREGKAIRIKRNNSYVILLGPEYEDKPSPWYG